MSLRVPEKWEAARVLDGQWASPQGANFGAFRVSLRSPDTKRFERMHVIVSDGDFDNGVPWEHVSVSLQTRCPTWAEMAKLKSMLWEPEDVVVQFHPRESEYVNVHDHCLHMWRYLGGEFPTPPKIAV